jgi:glycosyltransferase involved in cell wall biosynthesis
MRTALIRHGTLRLPGLSHPLSSTLERHAPTPATDVPPSRRAVVLSNVLELRGNAYARLWSDAVQRAGAHLLPLTMSTVLGRGAARPAWVHLQWPEWAASDARSWVAARRSAKALGLVLLARARGTRVMVTAHNVWSHDRPHPTLEAVLWTLLGMLTTDLHLLSVAGRAEFLASHPTFSKAAVREIPHGNYDAHVRSMPSQARARVELGLPAAARLFATLGTLKPYKGIEGLLDAFGGLDDPDARLVIAGQVADDALMDQLVAARRRDSRLVVIPGFLSDADMVRLVRAADAVVLPYRRVLNSGGAVLALTLGRPVLLPATPTFASLRERVGRHWVTLFNGRIGPADLDAMRPRATDEFPDLAWCSWDVITEQLRSLWTSAAREPGD